MWNLHSWIYKGLRCVTAKKFSPIPQAENNELSRAELVSKNGWRVNLPRTPKDIKSNMCVTGFMTWLKSAWLEYHNESFRNDIILLNTPVRSRILVRYERQNRNSEKLFTLIINLNYVRCPLVLPVLDSFLTSNIRIEITIKILL